MVITVGMMDRLGNFFCFGRPNASAAQFIRDRALRYQRSVNRVIIDYSSSKWELV